MTEKQLEGKYYSEKLNVVIRGAFSDGLWIELEGEKGLTFLPMHRIMSIHVPEPKKDLNPIFDVAKFMIGEKVVITVISESWLNHVELLINHAKKENQEKNDVKMV